MGKSTITGGGTDGIYTATINYDRTKIEAKKATLNTQIAQKEAEILTAQGQWVIASAELVDAIALVESLLPAYSDENKKPCDDACVAAAVKRSEVDALDRKIRLLKMTLVSLQADLAALTKVSPDPTISIHCADYTTTLSGVVATIDTPGGEKNIVPGYSMVPYAKATHGQDTPTQNQSAAGTVYALAMEPGWEKWRPIYRRGVITRMVAPVADVLLDSATADKRGDLNVNKDLLLQNVTFKYMTCDWRAFKVGDRVIVKFTTQRWETPQIIGFSSNPRKCPLWVENFDGITYEMGRNNKADFPSGWIVPTKSGTPIYDAMPTTDVFQSFYGPYAAAGNDVGLVPGPFTPDAWAYLGIKACMTNDGHKLFMITDHTSITGGQLIFPGGATYFQWACLLPGDCQYIKFPDGSQSSDTVIPISWTALEVTVTFEQFPASIDRQFPSLSIALIGSWDDDPTGGDWNYPGAILNRAFCNFNANMITVSPADIKTFHASAEDVDQYPWTAGWDSGSYRSRAISTWRNYPLPFATAWGYGDGWVVGWTNQTISVNPLERDGYYIGYFYDNNAGYHTYNTVTLTCRVEKDKFNMNYAANAIVLGANLGHRVSIDRIAFYDD